MPERFLCKKIDYEDKLSNQYCSFAVSIYTYCIIVLIVLVFCKIVFSLFVFIALLLIFS